jgi:hypothetical protein
MEDLSERVLAQIQESLEIFASNQIFRGFWIYGYRMILDLVQVIFKRWRKLDTGISVSLSRIRSAAVSP